MKFTENFIKQCAVPKSWDWGHNNSLKYEYENQNSSEVKSYKLSKKELEEHLKKLKK